MFSGIIGLIFDMTIINSEQTKNLILNGQKMGPGANLCSRKVNIGKCYKVIIPDFVDHVSTVAGGLCRNYALRREDVGMLHICEPLRLDLY